MKEFKKEIQKLRTLLSFFSVLWEGSRLDILSLLLQNLGHDSSDCVNYDKEEELERVRNIIKALEELKKYNEQCPVTQFICEEAEMLYTGYIVMRD